MLQSERDSKTNYDARAGRAPSHGGTSGNARTRRRHAVTAALLASTWVGVATLLAACSGTRAERVVASSIVSLNVCLTRDGIAHPREAFEPTPDELAVPAFIGIRGLRVPQSVTRTQFQNALKRCGAGRLRVAPAPITSMTLQREILSLAGCLARNGFALPHPDFQGPGPVFDTTAVNVGGARWQATVEGCRVNPRVTKTNLMRCMGGKRGLEGNPKTNTAVQERYVELPRCLREEGPQGDSKTEPKRARAPA